MRALRSAFPAPRAWTESSSVSENGRLQFLHLTMFFEKLIEQHRVHCIVAHRVDLTVLVAYNQIWVHFGYVFGYQTKLRSAPAGSLLVVKRHRLQRQDRFASTVHRFDFLFKPL